MSFMPFHMPRLWLRGLLAAAPLAVGAYCLAKSFERRRVVVKRPPDDTVGEDAVAEERTVVAPWRLGLNRETGLLLAAVGLIGWSVGGGRAYALSRRREKGTKPRDGEDRRLRRPDGTELHVETYGRKDGSPILFIHGLGSDCDEWFEIRQRLADRHRLIDWDLAGLGESTPPCDGDWGLERAAADLNAVLNETAGDRRVVLLGHSLGGMILLTFCRLFPETLKRRVAGLVLAHTTYTNPMKTNSSPGLALTLQKPLVEPLCRLTIALSPLLWPVSVLDYLTGEAHRSLAHNLFTGHESREMLDFLAGYFVEDRPGAIARYSLAMLRYEETATLDRIETPTLIVVGDRDDSCVPEAHRFMHERIRGSRLLTLSPAKHGGLLEYPEQFAEALEEFTAECAGGQNPSEPEA